MHEPFNSVEGKRFLVLSILLFWCASMIAVRVHRTGSGYYLFLLWNLFLAGVPLILSTTLRRANRRKSAPMVQLGLFGIWLLFLPNAPYILTDILHLTRESSVPAWYDLALLLSCAGTGLLLGYLSLIDVHRLVDNVFGTVAGWIVALSSLVLSGFAIYLGRFLRLNSWDVLVRPFKVFALSDRIFGGSHPKTLSVTFVFGILLVLGYISLRILLAHPQITGNETKSA
jgi:uncharacterized membrane protein